ncbi:Imm7 family immunity protein [Niabella hibiscisoli]|uniref:Imm7 family immunity protein n=1 Tax=Niabella hibiscisoli TaxID=1825928 RepID=UPI001F0ECF40|nr:Imm7 family immunity protein [Niabella hibiscisoli]MCH5715193.1 Imm7 family immunity protein [Niabella hibiscisoli]
MVEYYGWANISASYKVEEENLDEDLQLRKIIKDINNKILETKSRTQVQFINGAAILRWEGYINHWGKEIDDVLEIWEFITKTAIGSYGIFYLRNDEADVYNFTIYRMAKGKVEELKDSMLSPTNSIIEQY